MLKNQRNASNLFEKKMQTQDDNFELEMSKRFTTKERTEMKLTQLDNYCLFIASPSMTLFILEQYT